MSAPFSNTSAEFDRRTRRSNQETKLEAAKESVLIELERLPEDMPVVLLAFNTMVSEIARATAARREVFESALRSVEPNNGTDISAALRAAATYAQQPGPVSVVLVSDGLSGSAETLEAALECGALGISVHMILIDPTERGESLARRIAGLTHGRWEAVTGRAELADATARSAATAAAMAEQAAAMLSRASDEAEAVRTETADREPLSFTAAYPATLTPEDSGRLWFYVYLAAMQAELESRLATLASDVGRHPARASAVSHTIVPPGRILEIRPVLDQIRCVPASQNVVWSQELEQLRFELNYVGTAAEATCRGRVEVAVDGLLVAEVPLVIQVAVGRSSVPQVSSARMWQRVFASYAHEDEAVVRSCKAAYRALGINLFVDRDDLEAGQPWRSVLREMIAGHDLFQLYWSADAAASTHVAEECQFALRVAEGRPAGDNFIRPLYWRRPMTPPPAALASLHFRYLDANSIDTTADTATKRAPARGSAWVRFEAVFPVIACALEPTGSTSDVTRRALSSVIPFIERITGLRYYPPPTLLVEDYVVSSVRTGIEPGASTAGGEDAGIVMELLRSLALTFHTGSFVPGRWWQDPSMIEFKNETDRANFNHVRRNTEGVFHDRLRRTLAGEDPAKIHERTLAAMVADLRADPRGVGTGEVSREIQRLLVVASPDDTQRLRDAFDPDLLADLGKDKGPAWRDRLIAAAGAADVVAIADRYESALGYCFDEPAILPTTSFSAYAAEFIRLMNSYATRASERFDDAVIDNGFGVSARCLEWVNDHFPGSIVDTAENSWPGAEYTWRLTRRNFLQLMAEVGRRVLLLLNDPGRNRPSLVRTSALTFGAFTHGGKPDEIRIRQSCAQNGIPGFALPPPGPKVLICTNAFERLTASLRSAGIGEEAARESAEKFLLITLVHEHLHAAIAVGLDSDGQTASAARDVAAWQRAGNLNEALAAWATIEFARDDPELLEACWEYVRHDDYPQWPYRGAERIESLVLEHGPAALRSLIALFRDDPEVAQRRFDSLGRPGTDSSS